MNSNTTSAQDTILYQARNNSTLVQDLLDIIDDLDTQLDCWADATDCGEPQDAKAELESRAAGIDQLKTELKEVRGLLEDSEVQRNSLERERDAADADARDTRRQLETAERRIEELETQIVEATT